MRPNQNRRVRGRNRPKGPNPLTRSYESNGPDVKIRGTAQHIADKYAQLARDAQASGDPVAAENYFQHGEHYFRIISGAQEQNRLQAGGYARNGFDDDGDEDGGDDQGAPLGYAAQSYNDDYGDPGQQPQPAYQPPAYEGRQDGQRHENARQDGGPDNRQNRNDRNDRRDRFNNRSERPQRFDNQRQDGQRQDYNRQDSSRQDSARQDPVRQDPSRQDNQRPDYSRQDQPRQDRDRPEQPRQDQARQDQPRQEYGRRNNGQRFENNRGGDVPQDIGRDESPRHEPVRQDTHRQDVQRQDPVRQEPVRQEPVRQEAPRQDFQPSEARRPVDAPPRRSRRREESERAPVEDVAGLPAFLMTPPRPAPVERPVQAPATDATAPQVPVQAGTDEASAAPKPRRRRRARFEGTDGAEPGVTGADDSSSGTE